MNFEDHKWNQAELDFNHWLTGTKVESAPDRTNILKSAYLVFREKESERLRNFCNHAFEVFRDKEIRTLDEPIQFPLRIKSDIVSNSLSFEEPKFRINYFINEDPGYWKSKTKAENDVLIQGILSGEQSIFDDLYEVEFPKVVRLVTKNSGTLDAAKDVFQDGLVILMEKVYRKELDLTCSVGTYLYAVCRNLWQEQLRKDQKSTYFNDPYSNLVADITPIGEETIPDVFDSVNKAIETLGDPCKQLLECFYYENLSWVEIASSLGYSSAASARNQKYKCLERIRRSVGAEAE
ncbi:MAG TPA: hypothetical protein DCL77_16720 [Prolixibacteraceae bacterium]|jgi:RNA polymerase sigma factor (sigma-70 family)|nr:hypothetical protein [Prolixibacteraceae bacterium]